jgi:hypothetical protein
MEGCLQVHVPARIAASLTRGMPEALVPLIPSLRMTTQEGSLDIAMYGHMR